MCTRHEPHNPHCATCLADAPAESIFDWHPWSGGEMPVPPGVLIDVEYRNGSGRAVTAGELGATSHFWMHCNDGADIVKYRLRNPLVDRPRLLEDPENPQLPRRHSHYFKDVSQFETVDVYRVLSLFAVADPCIQHAVKKLLVAGGRGGGKPIDKDVQEAIDTLVRWQAMRAEEVAS
jgi:hypothetical protein